MQNVCVFVIPDGFVQKKSKNHEAILKLILSPMSKFSHRLVLTIDGFQGLQDQFEKNKALLKVVQKFVYSQEEEKKLKPTIKVFLTHTNELNSYDKDIKELRE